MNTYPAVGDLLRTISEELRHRIVPTLSDDTAKLSASLIQMLVGALEARTGADAAIEATHGAQAMDKLAKVVLALPVSGDGSSAARQVVSSFESARTAPDLESRSRSIAAAIEALLELSGDRPDATPLREFVGGFLDTEVSRRTRLFDALAAAETAHEDIDGTPRRTFNTPAFTEALRARHPDHPRITAKSVTEIGGGFSKRTFRVRIDGGPPHLRDVIVRQDMSEGPIHSRVVDEVRVLEAARVAGVPVPRVYWHEERADLGKPCNVLQACAGECSLQEWQRCGPTGVAPGLSLARALATLHQIPAANVSPESARGSPQESILKHIKEHEDRWRAERFQAEPLMSFGFEWLERNIPNDMARLSIVHTDISERNILVHDGVITAILDWELWHVGDHNEDLAYAKPFIEAIMDWEDFLAAYHSHGGPPYDERRARFWAVWAPLRILTYQTTGIRSYVEGRNRSIKMITPLVRWNALFLRQLADALQAAGA